MNVSSDDLYGNLRKYLPIISPSVAFIGCQLSWAVQSGWATAYLSELGLGDDQVNYAWLAGPISGILVQPIVGIYSDHSTNRFGRRRPFIFAGAFCTMIALIAFSNAQQIGYFFGDSSDARYVAISIALITFWILDFSTNLLEGPCRALISDTCTEVQQLESNSWFGVNNGLAQAVGYAVAACLGIQKTFLIASVVVVLSATGTLFLAKETRYEPDEDARDAPPIAAEQSRCGRQCRTVASHFKEVWWGITHMPSVIVRCWFVQSCAFFGFFAMYVYLADYYGTELMDGDADADTDSEDYKNYEKGITYGNIAFCSMAIVGAIMSYFSPIVVRVVGLKPLWCASLLIFAVVFLVTPSIAHPYLAICLHSCAGFAISASYTLPWSIVTKYCVMYDEAHAGLWTTIFNISECFPEIFIALFGGDIVDAFDDRVSSVLFFGGLFAMIGAFLVLQVRNISDADFYTFIEELRTIDNSLTGTATQPFLSGDKDGNLSNAGATASPRATDNGGPPPNDTNALMSSTATEKQPLVADGSSGSDADYPQPIV